MITNAIFVFQSFPRDLLLHVHFKRPLSTDFYLGHVAFGYANGTIKMYTLQFEEQDQRYRCHSSYVLDVWKEEDMISVTFVEFVFPKVKVWLKYYEYY